MSLGIRSATEALDFSIEMVPDGKFDEDETGRRRHLWQLWGMLPQLYRPYYPEIFASRLEEPIEWVRDVLNLPAS